MADPTIRTESELVAELNDLLQLDHDAVRAYTVAIEHLETAGHRETLERFRGDHERHIRELTRLIREHEGVPIELAHVPTGFFKLAVQQAGTAGGDREILLAFKANERQVRDKYARHAAREHPPEVHEVLQRNARDEARHYEWAAHTLDQMGYGPETMAGRAEAAFETAHERAADAMEAGERKLMAAAERGRRKAAPAANELGRRVRRHPFVAIAFALAIGYAAGRVVS